MNWRHFALAVGLATSLAGCKDEKTDEPIGSVPADAVIREIKREVLLYNAYADAHAGDDALPNACKGRVDLRVASFTLTLSTQTEGEFEGKVSATLPVGSAATVGPEFGLTSGTKNTQTISFTMFPLHDRDPTPLEPASDRWEGAPIAASLRSLREALLSASDTKPCFSFQGPDSKPQDNSYQSAVVVTKSSKAGAELKLVVFSLGASAERQLEASNVLKVNFVGDVQAIYIIKDECSKGDGTNCY